MLVALMAIAKVAGTTITRIDRPYRVSLKILGNWETRSLDQCG